MSRNKNLPPELAAKWGALPHLQYQGSGEWSASCPQCGDWGHVGNEKPDRFRLFEKDGKGNARGWCRRCGHFEWADEGEDVTSPSPEALQAAQEERTRLAKLEMERQQQKIRAIEDAAYWRGWHDQMTQEQRELWHEQGIADWFVDYYSLGYVTHHTYFHDGREWRSPAMTIPHYGDDWALTNIQYRLLDPQPGAGKYRQTPGLPAAMFRVEPEQDLSGAVLIVEGAKKAIVSYAHLGMRPLGFDLLIVGLPSKAPSSEMIAQLADAEPIYLLLDPDAYVDGTVGRVARRLGRERVRIAKTPVKPDDLIVQYGGSGSDLANFLKQAVTA